MVAAVATAAADGDADDLMTEGVAALHSQDEPTSLISASQ